MGDVQRAAIEPFKMSDLVALNNHYDMLQGRIFGAMLAANGILLGFGVNIDKFKAGAAFIGIGFTAVAIYLTASFRVMRSKVIKEATRRDAAIEPLLLNQDGLQQKWAVIGLNGMLLLAWLWIIWSGTRGNLYWCCLIWWLAAIACISATCIAETWLVKKYRNVNSTGPVGSVVPPSQAIRYQALVVYSSAGEPTIVVCDTTTGECRHPTIKAGG